MGNGVFANFHLKLQGAPKVLEIHEALVVDTPMEEILLGQGKLTDYRFVIDYGKRQITSSTLKFTSQIYHDDILRTQTIKTPYLMTLDPQNTPGPIRSIGDEDQVSNYSDSNLTWNTTKGIGNGK